MRSIIGLVLGLYLTVALVVLAGGVYGFLSGEALQPSHCEPRDLAIETGLQPEPQLEGGPNWIPFVFLRAAIWPKAYLDDQDKADDILDWLVVGYDPFSERCV